MKQLIPGLMLCVLLAACNVAAAPTPTPTETLIPTDTPAPTDTSTPTITPTATDTPTATATEPPTLTPSVTPTPSITPQPTLSLRTDLWVSVDLPDNLVNGLSGGYVAFVNRNDRETIRNLSTAQPTTGIETLYFSLPNTRTGRIEVLRLSAPTDDQIFVAPRGNAVAYFLRDGLNSGLYVLDIATEFSQRALALPSLVQRGFVTHPSWSPDGSQMALAIATGYEIDIFAFNMQTSLWENLTNHPAYDTMPVWSPDGRFIAFVSDRARCPSWVPGDPGACDASVDPLPDGGNVFLLEVATGEVRQVSDVWVTEPPVWVNPRLLAFASGSPAFGDPERALYIADVASGQARGVRLRAGAAQQINLSEAWSPDGSAVIFQSAGTSTVTALMTISGDEVGRSPDLNFPRNGMIAAWAPDGQRFAVGGRNGQCPYGARVYTREFQPIAEAQPPPSMCDPVFSPDGQYLAFTGVRTDGDGSVDVYVANASGSGAYNLTGDLRGTILLLGWVSP